METSIGFSVSNDNGKTFAKCGAGPILTSSLHEPFLVGDPFVNRYRDTFFMWFIYGVRWIRNEEDAPERVYKIGYAISEDGMDWRKQNRQIISDKLGPDECQALPTVVFHKDTYHMFFCYRSAVGFRDVRENMYKIGYAYSENLRDWTRDDGMFRFSGIDDDWDNEMQCYPYVFLLDEDLCMLYNGNKFGRYGFGLAVLEGEEKDNRRRVSVL